MFVRLGPYPNHHSRRPRQEVVRVHRYDTWSLDVALAKVIAPALTKFLNEWERYAGHPACFEGNGGSDEWRRVVDGMRLAFELIANDYDEALTEELFRREPIQPDENLLNGVGGGRLIASRAWAEYLHQRAAIDNLIQDGLDYFAKYFRNLWN